MYKVLIVEDDILVRIGMRNMIHWNEIDMEVVGEAGNGKEGLELYRLAKPDLILADIKMPIMDGLEMIQEIRMVDKQTRIIVLSCHEDYELVRQAFKLGISDYILKLEQMPADFEEVIKKVHSDLLLAENSGIENNDSDLQWKQKSDLPDFKNYILNGNYTYKEIKEILNSWHIKEEYLAICVMEYIITNDSVVVELIQSILSEMNRGFIWAEQENRYIILLSLDEVSSVPEAKNLCKAILQRIQKVIKNYIGNKVVFGVSNFCNSFECIHQLYQEALQTLCISRMLDENISFYETKYLRNKYESMLKKFKKEIAETYWVTESFKEIAEQEIDLLVQTEKMEMGFVREVFFRLISKTGFVIIQNDRSQKITYEAVEQLCVAQTLASVIDIVKTFMNNLYVNTNYRAVNVEVMQAVRYINEHYREEGVYLSRIADMVGMNQEYFSSLFKKKVGVGFSEYLNRLRVIKACELLKKTSLSISQISYMVGFRDESYFSGVFKKMVGVRPNDYRKHNIPLTNFDADINFMD